MEVQLGLPSGNVRVDECHDVNAVKLRLWTLIEKCDLEGGYTRANTAWLALQAIEALQKERLEDLMQQLTDLGQAIG